MIAIQLIDVKDFMHKLLCSQLFDHFLLKEALIRTYTDFSIDGRLNHDFFHTEDPAYEQLKDLAMAPFSLLRPACFQLIKGSHTPLGFQFIFLLSPQNQRRTIENSGCSFQPEDVTGMFLNLKYQDQTLTCTTGISYRTFSLDKSLEHEWDRLIPVFFKNHQIPFEML